MIINPVLEHWNFLSEIDKRNYQMTEMKKPKVGDTVHVKGVVRRIQINANSFQIQGSCEWYTFDSIVRIEPSLLKVGERIIHESGLSGVIIAIDDHAAWVKNGTDYVTCKIKYLMRDDR